MLSMMSQRTKRPFLNSKLSDSRHDSAISSVSERLMTLVLIMFLILVVCISMSNSGSPKKRGIKMLNYMGYIVYDTVKQIQEKQNVYDRPSQSNFNRE